MNVIWASANRNLFFFSACWAHYGQRIEHLVLGTFGVLRLETLTKLSGHVSGRTERGRCVDKYVGGNGPRVMLVNYVVILYVITIQTLAPCGRAHSHRPRLVLHSIRYT